MSEKYNNPLDSMEGINSLSKDEEILDTSSTEKIEGIKHFHQLMDDLKPLLDELNMVLAKNNLNRVRVQEIFLDNYVYKDEINQEFLQKTFVELGSNLNAIDQYVNGEKLISMEQNYFEITFNILEYVQNKLSEFSNYFQNTKELKFNEEIISTVEEVIRLVKEKREIFFEKARALNAYLGR